MFNRFVLDLYIQSQVRRKVLSMLEIGSLSMAAVFIHDQYKTQPSIRLFLSYISKDMDSVTFLMLMELTMELSEENSECLAAL